MPRANDTCLQRADQSLVLAALALLLAVLCFTSCQAQAGKSNEAAPDLSAEVESVRLEKLLARNLDANVSLPLDLIEAKLQAWRGLPIGERVARWAELYLQRGDATYLFGLKPGGYVADSLLVQDYKPDCVLFFYRCTDLARSNSAREAVLRALNSRFRGGSPAHVVHATGAVDYDQPAHLDYSLDIVRSGSWGRDVTEDIGVASVDSTGTSRYPPGSFRYIPTERLRLERVQNGDALYFVFDENSDRGRKFREKYGLVVGHQGIAQWVDGTLHAIHAASSDLPGVYEGNRIVRVPLQTYLRRVESFKGVIVTRLEETAP